MINNEDIIIKVTNNKKTPEAQKIINDALNIRKEVYKKQGRQENRIFDQFDEEKETIFLTCYVLKDNGQELPIGSIRTFKEKYNGNYVGRVSKIAVSEEYRNKGSAGVKGVPNNLFKAGENIIIEKSNKPDFFLIKSGPAAKNFYKRLGYLKKEEIFHPEEPNFPSTILHKAVPQQLNELEFKVEMNSINANNNITVQEELLTSANNEVKNYIEEGQNAASSSQSIDLSQKEQEKDQQITQTQEQEELLTYS